VSWVCSTISALTLSHSSTATADRHAEVGCCDSSCQGLQDLTAACLTIPLMAPAAHGAVSSSKQLLALPEEQQRWQ